MIDELMRGEEFKAAAKKSFGVWKSNTDLVAMQDLIEVAHLARNQPAQFTALLELHGAGMVVEEQQAGKLQAWQVLRRHGIETQARCQAAH